MVSYHGTQRTVRDNEGQSVYGGSDLVCVRGGWKVLDALPMAPDVRAAVTRQNDTTRRRRNSPVSWRRGGTTMSVRASVRTVGHEQGCSSLPGASVARAALSSRQRPRSRAIRTSRSFAHPTSRNTADCPPADAVVDFQGDDPEAGPCCDTRSSSRKSAVASIGAHAADDGAYPIRGRSAVARLDSFSPELP